MTPYRAAVSISDSVQPLMAQYARAKILGDGSPGGALEICRARKMPDVIEKALMAPILSGDAGAEALAASQHIVTSFIPALRQSSVFFRLLDGMMLRIPLRTRVAFLTAAATMSVVNEGDAVPVTRLSSDEVTIDPHKATGILAFSKELLKWLSTGGEQFLNMELRRAISASVDIGFLSLITDGSTPTRASVGSSPEAAVSDLKFLLDSTELTAESRPLFALSPDAARKAACLFDGNGCGLVFPTMSPTGGTLLNVPAIVCDALAAGTIALFDGMGIAGDTLSFELKHARHATIEMNDSPDSPPTGSTNLLSLWQRDLVAVMPEIYFGAERLRASAFSFVDGVAWGSGDSPA